MKKPEEQSELLINPRATETVAIAIPKDTLESLKEAATIRDMPVAVRLAQAVCWSRITSGHSQRLFSERVLERTASVLARHIQSEDELATILSEIRVEAAG